MTAPTDHPTPGSVLTEADVAKLRSGDVLKARKSFTNRDLLTKGDVVILQSVGEQGHLMVVNLYRDAAQYGWDFARFEFVNRPATRLKADYSWMSRPQPVSGSEGEGAIGCAANLLRRYAEFVRTVPASDLEVHPYLPEIEQAAEDLLASHEAQRAEIKARDAVIRDLVAGVLTYTQTGDAMTQGLKRKVWEPIIDRARTLTNGGTGQ